MHGFYDRVRADPLLAPVFAARIADADWPAHLGRMVRFWSAVILMDGGYHGRPMQAHAALPVDAAHFDRWLALFRETAARAGAGAAGGGVRRAGRADRREPRGRNRAAPGPRPRARRGFRLPEARP